ncbi:sensor histidine kinase [Azospirillum halopraeferens]|uniref:sensor histidine kinase n=1 Tax=Azospirillum halopraeferens TaxID=34010 RepID=UPI00041260F7|nr:sensor histidine kinase [Azospirillum halopraeferens]
MTASSPDAPPPSVDGRGRPWSLRRRLLLWLLAPLLALCGAMLLDAHVGAQRAADRAYDRLLAASALAIAERIIIGDDGPEVDLPYVALEMLGSTAQDRVYYRITGPGDRFVTGYPDLPGPSGGSGGHSAEPAFLDGRYRGEAIRIAVLDQPVLSDGAAGRFTIAVAQTRGERNRLAEELVLRSAERYGLLIAVTGVIAWVAVTRGLAPLNRLRDAIRARSPDDFSPLRTDVPAEVRDLVGAINQFMARLGASLEAMERFIADASHQLRTPLAGLQTRAELALRAGDGAELRDAVGRLLDSTRRTSRLAEQLLTHARASGGGSDDARRTLDLAALVADVARACVPAAAGRGVDLGVERAEPGALVNGDEVLLREMTRNLIDNAVRHGRAGGVINLRVLAAGADHGVRLEVEDDGPGIPAAERARVFERFYRIPGRGEGSGLGLAIVRDIALRHGGAVTLDDGAGGDGAGGRGLLVRVELPAEGRP